MSGTQVQLTSPETPAVAPENNAPAVDPNRPTWLPQEFATVEAYNASYAELRADHTRKSQELARLKGANVEVTGKDGNPVETPNDPANPAETPNPNDPPKIEEKKADDPPKADDPAKKPDEKADEEDPAKKVADAAGFKLDDYQTEYFTTGDVAPENRAKIADGLKDVLGDNALDIVNQYIDGQKVVHANDRKLYMDEAGGDDAYTAMTTWAAESLTKDEVGAFNKIIDGGDRNATLLAIRGLRAQYEAKNGRVPNNIRASGSATPTGNAPFNSSAEMTAAMRDPRYKTDEAYRANVAARIAASPNL